jgi:hypothetical protein
MDLERYWLERKVTVEGRVEGVVGIGRRVGVRTGMGVWVVDGEVELVVAGRFEMFAANESGGVMVLSPLTIFIYQDSTHKFHPRPTQTQFTSPLKSITFLSLDKALLITNQGDCIVL